MTEADSSVVLSSKRVCLQASPYHEVQPQNVTPQNVSSSQGTFRQLHHQIQQPLPQVSITPQNSSSQSHVQIMMSPSCSVGIQSGHLPPSTAPCLTNTTDSHAMQNSLPSSNPLPSLPINGVMNHPFPSCYNAGVLVGPSPHLQPTSQTLPQHRIVSPCQTTNVWPTMRRVYSKPFRLSIINPSRPTLYHHRLVPNQVQQGMLHPASVFKPGYQLVGIHQLPQQLPQQQPPTAIPCPMPHRFSSQCRPSQLHCNVPAAASMPPLVSHTFPAIQNFPPNDTMPASVSVAHIPTGTSPIQKSTTTTSHTTATSHSVLSHSSTQPLNVSEGQVLNSSAELPLYCSTGLLNISSARQAQTTSECQTPSIVTGHASPSSQNPPSEPPQSSCSMNSANSGWEKQCMYTADQSLLTSPSSLTNLPVLPDCSLNCEKTSKGPEKQSMDNPRSQESLQPAVFSNDDQIQTPLLDTSLNDDNTLQLTNPMFESVVNKSEQEQSPLDLNECSILQPSSPIFDLNLSITELPSFSPSPIKNTTLEVVQCPSNEVMEGESKDSEDDENRLCIVEDVCETSAESDKFPEIHQPQAEKSPVKGHLHTSLQHSHLEEDHIDDKKEEEQKKKKLEVKVKEEEEVKEVKEEEEEEKEEKEEEEEEEEEEEKEVERRKKEKKEEDHLTIIIVDSDEESSVNQPSPDEGYSSSSSPLEPTTDFISKLPFQSFDRLEMPLPALRPAGAAGSASEEEELQQTEDNGLTEDEIVDVVTVAPEEEKWKPNMMVRMHNFLS